MFIKRTVVSTRWVMSVLASPIPAEEKEGLQQMNRSADTYLYCMRPPKDRLLPRFKSELSYGEYIVSVVMYRLPSLPALQEEGKPRNLH